MPTWYQLCVFSSSLLYNSEKKLRNKELNCKSAFLDILPNTSFPGQRVTNLLQKKKYKKNHGGGKRVRRGGWRIKEYWKKRSYGERGVKGFGKIHGHGKVLTFLIKTNKIDNDILK